MSDTERAEKTKTYRNAYDSYRERKKALKKEEGVQEKREEADLHFQYFKPWTWPIKIWVIIFILILCGTIAGLGVELDKKLKEIAQLQKTQRKYTEWPNKDIDKAFSIKHQDHNLCLQPGVGLNEKNLTLRENCDEDHIRFKKISNNRLQQYKSKSGQKMCIAPLGDDLKMVYSEDCEPSGEISYIDNKIKYETLNKCFKVVPSGTAEIVKLVDDCHNATKFDLV